MRFLHSIIEWIEALESGEYFRKTIVFSLKISAVGAVIICPLLGLAIFLLAVNPLLIPLCVIGYAVIVIWSVLVFMLFRNRANKIAALSEESHLTFGPIAGVLTRLAGEFSLLFWSLIGILLLPLSILFIPIGLSLLKFFYMIAEYTGMVGDIATNIKKIEATLSTAVDTSAEQDETPSEEEG